MNVADHAVVFAYASLLFELVALPIPSEASTWQLLAAADGGTGDGALAAARRRRSAVKLVCYALPTAIGVIAWLLPGLALLWPALRGDAAPPSPAAIVAATVAIALGRGLTFTSVLQLRAAQRTGRMPTGLFRWSRNPGLVGMYCCFCGLVIASGMPVLWAVLPLYVGNMHGRVRLEEAHQHARLGAAWNDYAAAVPRYLSIPRLRSAP
jgi:protein-S-isoprenylcysteine O-methyltransferase Ste14